MSEDKMREEFEIAAKTAQGLDVTRLPHGGYRSFATHQAWWAWQASRAALVAEQQSAERETLGSYPVSGQIFFRESSNEWVLELTGSVNGTEFTARHTQPADIRPEYVAGLPSLYETAPDVEELVEALERIASWPNGGNRSGQTNIQMFAAKTLA